MTPGVDQPTLQLTVSRRIFVLVTVVVASTVLQCRNLLGGCHSSPGAGRAVATQDEVSWAVTFYILATAVTMPMTGWLVTNFGRGRVQFWRLAGFTFSTILCGFTQSLEGLVLWRLD